MFLSCIRRLPVYVLIWILVLGPNTLDTNPILASDLPNEDLSHLMERIDFGVKWWFIPLVDTYMETYRLGNGEGPTFYRLVHQPAMNMFWNDRMESIVNAVTLLPCRMETLKKDGERYWKESILFERDLGRARLLHEDHQNGDAVEKTVAIEPMSMDPLAAFYFLRNRLSQSNPYLELRGIADSRRFSLRGELVAEERIGVPAGDFLTYRLECTFEYWPQDGAGTEKDTKLEPRKTNRFTLWVSQDDHRFPIQIRYRLSLGSLWVKATSVESYDQGT